MSLAYLMIADAYRFIFPLLLIALIFAYFHLPSVAVIFVVLAGYVCYFFRNPRREVPQGDNLVVSPADGKVVKISPLAEMEGASAGYQVSIFLNIFDVHVNRSPIQGRLESLEYKRGKFQAAFKEEASQTNEQNILTIDGQGMRVVVKQIAGLIARRVVCWKKPGQDIERGELIGLIRFGSRVDIVLPRQVTLLVKVGDRVKGGSSVLGKVA